jgi:ribosome maturation factor RimP
VRDSQHIEDLVRAIASPIIRALALELVDVVCSGRGGHTLVRVFIDKPGGVTLGDCEQVHVSLGHALDVENPIPHAYTLEVSSPGLDRPLKQRAEYERSCGKRVRLKLRTPLNGQWSVVGTLLAVDDLGVTVGVPGGKTETPLHLEWTMIAETRREIEF